MTSVLQKMLRRIHAKGRGGVFVPRDFLDLGTRSAVDVALHRLTDRGVIRRLGQGVYDYPKQHDWFGTLSPDIDDVAQALARSAQSTIQISGAHAANALGLSTQVPAKALYLTDGNNRSVKVGNYTLQFRRAAPKNLLAAGTAAGGVFQALRYLGSDRVDDTITGKLSRILDDRVKQDLARLRQDAPAWMRTPIDRITAPAYQTAA